jgi:membrane associated rhomboid family serine protease
MFFASDQDTVSPTGRHLLDSLRFPAGLVAFLWLVHAYFYLSHTDPGEYGILPRRLSWIRGVVTAPLVHGSWEHLMSNSVPLFVLTSLTLYFYRRVAIRAFWLIYFMTGLAVWLLGRSVIHIGASGVVYGLVAFIFWNGIFRRSARSIILALVVLMLYSSMFLGILPDQEGISWESHLLGSLSGIFAAFWFKEELEDDEAEHRHRWDENAEEKRPFLPRDIFDKTKAQRALEAEEEARRQQQERQDDLWPPFWNSTWSA